MLSDISPTRNDFAFLCNCSVMLDVFSSDSDIIFCLDFATVCGASYIFGYENYSRSALCLLKCNFPVSSLLRHFLLFVQRIH